jgi:hypothetical protein
LRAALLALSLLVPVLLVPAASAGTWCGVHVCCAFPDGEPGSLEDAVLNVGESAWFAVCAAEDELLQRDPGGAVEELRDWLCGNPSCV